jgi:hypothetical protein
MTTSVHRIIGVSLCMAVSSGALLRAQTHAHYRAYQMGDDLLTISRQIGVASPAVTIVPSGGVRDLNWRAHYVRRGAGRPDDPVAQLIFSFYEDQLFRIVIDYAADRTEGMTEADMVAAVSQVYGAPAKRTHPTGQASLRPQRLEDTVIAEWTNSAHHVSLRAVGGQAAFRLIVASTPLEALARAAGAREAPAALQDPTSIEAGRLPSGGEKTAPARKTVRLANIASFVL